MYCEYNRKQIISEGPSPVEEAWLTLRFIFSALCFSPNTDVRPKHTAVEITTINLQPGTFRISKGNIQILWNSKETCKENIYG